jgi:hypothetical protein
MYRLLGWSAVLAIAVYLGPAVAAVDVAPSQPAKLRFDPRFILEAVAQRMKVTLRPDVPLPAIFVESATPLRQFQDAMEGQWQFRPPVVTNAYTFVRNEIYLVDDADFYVRFERTLDDSLAHELVHYIQAKYLREDLTTEGCEIQAVEIQRWFREFHVQANRDLGSQVAGAGKLDSGDDAPTCIVLPGVAGARVVQCVTGSRPVPG